MNPRSPLALLLCIFALVIAGCGGGGDSTPAAPAASTPTPAGTAAGGGTAQSTGIPQSKVANVLPLTVEGGPTDGVNLPFVSVTICAPGTTRCQTVDHILVDTGSTGLRLFSAVLDPSLGLPQQSLNSAAMAECMQFADGYTWGPVKQADIKLSGEQASSAAIQVMGDPAFSNVPTECGNTGPSINTVQDFGANGVLGTGLFLQDCGPACAQSGTLGLYYSCAGTCAGSSVPVAQQVHNPVALFATDNNGVLLKLPSVPATGAPPVTGSLIFGIGTQDNNTLGSATVLSANPSSGYITTVYKSRSFPESFFDSGSNGNFFPDTAIPACRTSFYCPPSTLNLTAVNRGTNGAPSSVNFQVANADQLFSANTSFAVYNSLAGSNPNPRSFDWGLSFFFGRNVFTAIEGRATPGGNGPYFAY